LSEYTASHVALRDGARRVDGTAQVIDAVLATLTADVEAMLAGWRGEAASAFAGLHGRFAEHAGRIVQSLRSMHDALEHTGSIYGRQESDGHRALSNLANRINA
jgi:WXG100 family type VII secretion target